MLHMLGLAEPFSSIQSYARTFSALVPRVDIGPIVNFVSAVTDNKHNNRLNNFSHQMLSLSLSLWVYTHLRCIYIYIYTYACVYVCVSFLRFGFQISLGYELKRSMGLVHVRYLGRQPRNRDDVEQLKKVAPLTLHRCCAHGAHTLPVQRSAAQ